MRKYFWMVAIVALIGLFFGSSANAQHRGPHHPPHRKHHYTHYHHQPHHRTYHHSRGTTVRINAPVPRPPHVIVHH